MHNIILDKLALKPIAFDTKSIEFVVRNNYFSLIAIVSNSKPLRLAPNSQDLRPKEFLFSGESLHSSRHFAVYPLETIEVIP